MDEAAGIVNITQRLHVGCAAAPKPARLAAGQAGPKGNLREFLEADKKVRCPGPARMLRKMCVMCCCPE